MAIYKPSNLYPNLAEIDMTQDNTFTCQVNTTGESAMAYKIQILSTQSGVILQENDAQNFSTPVKNKNFASFPAISNVDYPTITNGNDYYWSVRLYNAMVNSTARPNTLVCSGFLVGSTTYVIWTNNNDKIEYDMWLEFNTTGSSNMFPILEPNTDNLTLPATGETFRERYQIDWVESELGFNKNITKIELKDSFTYNYIQGTPFTLYRVSDQHTYTSVYVEPNDNLTLSYYIVLYNNKTDADNAAAAGDTPKKITVTPRETARKIVGYGEETGEVRVQQAFNQIPVNGNYYLLYEYDQIDDTYTIVTSDVDQVVGGVAITDDSFTVITNNWDSNLKQIFIQPNINIKSDATNPNEIVFDDGTRVDIVETFSSTLVPGEDVNITFNKLDNTQWLLQYLSTSATSVPIIPGSNYKVYTDFMDSSPYCLFYARTTPELDMQFKNANDITSVYQTISSTTSYPYRDISFYTDWNSAEGVQVKYYQYYLYDDTGDMFAQSEEIYDTSLEWTFMGFQSSAYEANPQKYVVQIKIVDEYNREFVQQAQFGIFYNTDESIVPMEVEYSCDEQAIKVVASSPVYVESTDYGSVPTATSANLNPTEDYLEIPSGMCLNYTNVINEEKTPIIIPSSFSFITQFQLTGEFMTGIEGNAQQTIFEIGRKNLAGTIDTFALKIGGMDKFYKDSNGVYQENTNQFQIQLFKNGNTTPLTCFNNGTQNYYNVMTEDPYKEIVTNTEIAYVLQSASDYTLISAFPLRPQIGVSYALTQDTTLNGIKYYKGIYTYENNKWVPDYSKTFMFLESLDDVNLTGGTTYDGLSVPENCQSTNDVINWEDDGNVWLDFEQHVKRVNSDIFDKKWFLLYLIVNETADSETVTCQIQMNNGRV